MTDKLSIYHKLPHPLKDLAASAWGVYLRSWRYGAETERLVAETLERESWNEEKWKNWQQERLAFILHRAATQVPYYRTFWEERRKNGDRSSWEILANWPVLDKGTLRQQASAFVAEDCQLRKMYADHTSGTTGTPLTVWLKRTTARQWYAIFEARTRRWFDVTYKLPWGIFGGQVVVPFSQKKPPYWVRNISQNQTYFSVLHIAPWTFQAFIDEIKKRQLTHMIAYTNSLYSLACEVPLEMQPVKSKVRAIFTNAEPLFDFQRKKLKDVFDCPVIETYGLVEMACAASECENGKMHWWPEVGVPEIIDDEGEQVKPGETGRLIATGLLNSDMPLIRYDTKDLSTRPLPEYHCECKRSLPLAGKFVGRYDDVILTQDGRRLTQLDTIFDPHLPLKEAQIVQNTLDDFEIRVIVDKGWTKKDADYIRTEFQKRVGNVIVRIKEEEKIERTWAGKFRIIVSKIDH